MALIFADKINRHDKYIIHGYDKPYYVDTMGNVYYDHNKIFSPQNNGAGYMTVKLFKDGRRINRYVHRLVWTAINGDIPIGYEINHIDHNRSNNNLDNLELVTHQENMKKCFEHNGYFGFLNTPTDGIHRDYYCVDCGVKLKGKAKRCLKCHKKYVSSLTNRPSKDILKNLIRSYSFTYVGKMFNVSCNCIRKWCKYYDLPYRKKDIKNYSDVEWDSLM